MPSACTTAAAVEPVATVTAESTVWSGVLFGGLPLADAERDGTVRVEGASYGS